MFGGFFTRPKMPNVSGDFSLFSLFSNYFHCFFTGTQGHFFNVLFTRDKHFSTFFSHATNVFFTRGSHKSLRARGGASGVREHCACGKHHCSGPWLRKKIIFGRRFFFSILRFPVRFIIVCCVFSSIPKLIGRNRGWRQRPMSGCLKSVALA